MLVPRKDLRKTKPAKLYFTVTKDGAISNVSLDRISGYVPMDEAMIDLLKNVPGSWQPAENAEGEKVDQELVITFSMSGC